MNRLIIFVICAFLSVNAMSQPLALNENEPLETVYQKKAFELFGLLTEEENLSANICFSPLSVQMAMSMLQNGAAGNTLSQMQYALGTKGYTNDEVNAYNQKLEEMITYRPPFTYNQQSGLTEEGQREYYDALYPICEMANGLWTRPGTVWHEQFMQTLRNCYKAGIGCVDFASQDGIDEINAWVNDKTHELIPTLYDKPLSDDIAMVLANALYFKGNWSRPFDPCLAKVGIFHNSDGSDVQTEMMALESYLPTSKTESFCFVKMFYGEGDFTMTIFLPMEGTTLPDLTYKEWKQAFDYKGYNSYTYLQMPSFVVDGKYNLNDVLKKMGIMDAFDSNADFCNMRDNPLSIGKVSQCGKIAVHEKGTEAAAVTIIDGYEGMSPDNAENFIVDRPFYFTIEHRNTGSVLFVGRVTQLQGTALITPLVKEKRSEAIYDLTGRRLMSKPARGIYIRGGRKFVF